MYINWEGIKKFLGWKGTIEEMKRLELPPYVQEMPKKNDEIIKENTSFTGGISKSADTITPLGVVYGKGLEVLCEAFAAADERQKESAATDLPNDLAIRHIPLPRKEKAMKDDDRQDIMFEAFDGLKCIHLGVTKEDRDRLSQKGVVTPYEDEDVYHLHVREGDLVRLRDGRLGTVRMVERGLNAEKIVSVDVDGAPRRWFGLRAPLPVRFVDREINYLKFIATKEDLQAIEVEVNE